MRIVGAAGRRLEHGRSNFYLHFEKGFLIFWRRISSAAPRKGQVQNLGGGDDDD
jgi:hypothetical protein